MTRPVSEWVDTWVSAPQPTFADNLPPPPYTRDGTSCADCTLRQTVRTSVGGQGVRLCLSNAFGGIGLGIAAVSVALPRDGRAGASAIEPGSARRVMFDGRPSVLVPAGSYVESDPVDLAVAARSNVAVTVRFAGGVPADQVTSHPGSRTTSYLLAGDHLLAEDLPGSTPTDHWYFLSGLRVPSRPTTVAMVLVGDSLTDGRGSTTNRNDRWPDLLLDRLQAHPQTRDIAVLNRAAGGTELLDDGQGPGTVARVIHGVLDRDAVRWLILFKGINDIGAAAPTRAAQQAVAEALVRAYQEIIAEVGRNGVQVYGATLPPFGGHAGYDDPQRFRELGRQQVNEWVRASGQFDGVLDFDLAVRDPGDPRRLAPAFDSGDHLHLNPAGYRALAGAVDIRRLGATW